MKSQTYTDIERGDYLDIQGFLREKYNPISSERKPLNGGMGVKVDIEKFMARGVEICLLGDVLVFPDQRKLTFSGRSKIKIRLVKRNIETKLEIKLNN